MVRFKLSRKLQWAADILGHNSTMVRFKLFISPKATSNVSLVTIPLWFDSNPFIGWIQYLFFLSHNSTMVRFKLFRVSSRQILGYWLVTIPLWFDSNALFNKLFFNNKIVTIPLWFDSNKPVAGAFLFGPAGSQFHYGSIQTVSFRHKIMQK